MNWRQFFGIVLPHVLESAFILLLSIFIPFVLLIFSWDQSPLELLDFPTLLPLANSLKKLPDVLLVIVPLTSLYIATCFAFLYRYKASQTFRVSLLFFIPFWALLACQPLLYLYHAKSHSEVLSLEHLGIASAVIYVAITAIFWLDIFMSITRASSTQVRFRPPPPRGQRARDGQS